MPANARGRFDELVAAHVGRAVPWTAEQRDFVAANFGRVVSP